MSEWFLVLVEQLGSAPRLNWVVFFVVACHVFLAKANSVWLYPAGIAALAVVFYNSLVVSDYASTAFSGYCVLMLTYGWMYWSARGTVISYANHSDWWVAFSIVGAAFVVLYLILALVADAPFAIWEAGVGATACGGVWLLSHRKVEYWVLLNVSQAFAVPLLIHSDRFLYGLLSLFLYIFAFFGMFSWRRIIHQQRNLARA
jgi:nicotinamide mononucleotide transporter